MVVWVFGLERWRKEFYSLQKRIRRSFDSQGKRKNLKWVFTYLKESYTVCYSILTKNAYEPKVRISRDSKGLPRIIPWTIRQKMLDDRVLFVGCLTILGIHRVLNYTPKVDYSTIRDPFKGLYKTLDLLTLKRAKDQLCELAAKPLTLNIGQVRSLELNSKGPNYERSILGCVYDAWAFYTKPGLLLALTLWYLHHWGFRPLISLWSILLISWPLYLYMRCIGHTYNVGRLTVVKNTAGKARVIAIVSYWIQIALFPLHQGIFRILKQLPTDGTFDQMAPLKRLFNKGIHFNSFDLTAATDRLPLVLQVDVLSLYIGRYRAKLWSLLLSFPFASDNGEIRYSVGQPMGAYSSWAMLALTHHHIVQASSPSSDGEYAVLGDDVIVSDNFNYLSLMTSLGVDISLAKSIQSCDWLEFAKKVFTSGGRDWSIAGPGLLLGLVRNRYLYGLALASVYLKGYYLLPTAVSRLERFRKMNSPESFNFGLYTLFGPYGLVQKNAFVATKVGMKELPKHLAAIGFIENTNSYFFKKVVSVQEYKRIDESKKAFAAYVSYIFYEIMAWRSVPRFLYFLILFLSPCIWVPLGAYLRTACSEVDNSEIYKAGVDELALMLNQTHSDKLGVVPRRIFKDALKGYRLFAKECANRPMIPLAYSEFVLRSTSAGLTGPIWRR